MAVRFLHIFAGLLLSTLTASAAQDSNPAIDLSRSNPLPVYPPNAQQIGETGTAAILIRVSDTGEPLDVQLAQSAGFTDLDRAALAAARQWHLVPGFQNGRPAMEWIAAQVKFEQVQVTLASSADPQLAAEQRVRLRVICQRGVGDTGSRIPGPKKCLPKWQWDDIEKNDQREFNDYLRRASHP